MERLAAGIDVPAVPCGCAHFAQSRHEYHKTCTAQVAPCRAVLTVRPTEIADENSTAGGASAGNGFGGLSSGVAAGVAGDASGSAPEQPIRSRRGGGCTIALRNGAALTIARNVSDKNLAMRTGDRAMARIGCACRRVLPAMNPPKGVARPKGVELK